MYRILNIKIEGKVLFRGPGEFDMSSAGVRAYASTMFYPLPTTIASILIYSAMSSGGTPNPNDPWGDWVREYISVMKGLGIPRPWGPIIKVTSGDSTKYYICYDQRRQLLIGIGSRKGGVDIPPTLYVERSLLDRPSTPVLNGHVETVDISRSIRTLVGINLRSAGNGHPFYKTTGGEEGKSVYSAEYLFPEGFVGDPYTAKAPVTVEYQYLLFAKGSSKNDTHCTRIGGEGGYAVVSTREVADGPIRIDMSRWSGNLLGLYVLSPVLIPTHLKMHGFIKKELGDILGTGIRELYIVGESTLLGAGLARSVKTATRYIPMARRPLYKALKPGSILYFKPRPTPNIDDLEKLLRKGIGIGKEIGFGSLLPINYRYGGHKA